ncbi:MAG: winged helix-turn-helix domain-containing protein [Candidatus Bathyarchaeota archaeon]|nr:winged helix-turn-helix domain-containing protein [Candidatus Bathyarchaeota archaeon]
MVRSYRSDWKIIMEILECGLGKGTKKTHIMYRANLNFVSFNKYFFALLEKGLMVELNDPDGGMVYRTSEKGRDLFKLLTGVNKSLPSRQRPAA